MQEYDDGVADEYMTYTSVTVSNVQTENTTSYYGSSSSATLVESMNITITYKNGSSV